ncbi:hypothetical protein HHA01_21140 [Halomonas halmophila]|uniref:Uncharacterized protein n=1 Tax=Halomonas halmophila TaxID=252 RepID=A0A4Y4F108_9GAMM|nr:hypothetical protein HHA01_21140 [Halomonas halmophila]
MRCRKLTHIEITASDGKSLPGFIALTQGYHLSALLFPIQAPGVRFCKTIDLPQYAQGTYQARHA